MNTNDQYLTCKALGNLTLGFVDRIGSGEIRRVSGKLGVKAMASDLLQCEQI